MKTLIFSFSQTNNTRKIAEYIRDGIITVCPTTSIGSDWEPLLAMVPANYKRYKEELDRVTARGGFRWLIEPDSINLADPLYKQRERESKNKK